MTPLPDHDRDQAVRLSVPASTRFLASVRLVAASLGADAGLSVDDLEDLRLGVDELVSALIDGATPGARVDLELVAGEGTITVSGSITTGAGSAVADELTRRILDAVVDHHELGASTFVLTKASSLRERI